MKYSVPVAILLTASLPFAQDAPDSVTRGTKQFEKRVVKLGMEQHGRVQVLEGVKAGEKIVTDGSFILKSEMLKSEMEAD